MLYTQISKTVTGAKQFITFRKTQGSDRRIVFENLDLTHSTTDTDIDVLAIYETFSI